MNDPARPAHIEPVDRHEPPPRSPAQIARWTAFGTIVGFVGALCWPRPWKR